MKKKIILMCLIILITSPVALLAYQTPEPPFQPDFYNEWRYLPTNTYFDFELQNIYNPDGIKTVWFYMESSGSAFMKSVITTPGGIEPETIFETYGPGRYTWMFTLTPQPSSEIVHIFFGTETIVTYAAMASHCSTVPIPGALWLLGSGLVGLAGLRRRFKK
ncbi:MAG: hypothetical protein NT010_09125 [Proteobacteria bacterium]|nr:hypothetical protein [Pseudomonadota bacterium]